MRLLKTPLPLYFDVLATEEELPAAEEEEEEGARPYPLPLTKVSASFLVANFLYTALEKPFVAASHSAQVL